MSCLIDTKTPRGEVRESVPRQADEKCGGPQGDEGSGVLKEEERTSSFFSRFLSLSHIKRFYL